MDYVFPALITMLGHGKVSQYGRDSAMELVLKFITRQEGAGWSKKFIEAEGMCHFYYFTFVRRRSSAAMHSPAGFYAGSSNPDYSMNL